MKRDFSESAKQRLLALTRQVEEDKLSDFTDWIGDRWYDFQTLIGDLNIRNYIDDVNEYHRKVIDKNNTSRDAINRIFDDVRGCSSSYRSRFTRALTDLQSYKRILQNLTYAIEPSNGQFNSSYIGNTLHVAVSEYVSLSIEEQQGIIEGLTKYMDETVLQDVVILDDIPKDKVKKRTNLNIKEWHPFLGLTQTMVENVGDPSEGGIDTAIDAFSFFTSWLDNSTVITQLRVITSDDGHMVIEYGVPIENKYSGKHVSLNSVIVDKYYNYSPSIIFSADDKADEWIRSWFGLSGEGKYAMDIEFGKVYIGDCGYKLIFENGELYQVPIIHEGTTMSVYYKENGETKLVLDAAEILRNTKIKVPQEEAEKIICQLRDAGIIS